MNSETLLGRTAAAAGLLASLIGALELARVATGRLVIPEPLPGAIRMSGWVAAFVTALGAAVAWVALSRHRPAARRALGALAVAFGMGGLASLAAPAWAPPAATPGRARVLAGAVIVCASASLLLAALRAARSVSNLLAVGMVLAAGSVLLGYVYGGPLFVSRTWPESNLAGTLATLLVAAAVVALNGAEPWPVRLFAGDSVTALLLRWLLPVVVLVVVATDFATNLVFSRFSPALGSALNTTLSVVLAAVVILYVGGIIGRRLERSYEALRFSEEKFSRVFRSVPAGMSVSALPDGRFHDVNDEFTRIFGFQRDEVVGRTWGEMGMWADAAEREAVLEAVRGGGDVRGAELHLRARDGRPLVIRTALHSLRLGDEDLLVASFVDVTEQRAAQDALAVSEKRLATIFRESPVPLAVCAHAGGMLVSVNPAFLDSVGAASPAEVLGRSCQELGVWPPETEGGLAALTDRAGRVHDVRVQMRRLSGELRTVEMSVSRYELDGRVFLLSSSVDVTDRVRAEAERLEAERRFRELFEGVRDVVFSLTPEGVVSMLNPAFERLTGMPAGEWIGRPFADLVHPDDRARAWDQLRRSAAGATGQYPPLRVAAAEGGWRLAEIHAAPRLEEGRVVSILGIGRDVSERVALEEQLRQSQKMDAVGQLAGGIAHDFNNLLTVIIGAGQLALAGMAPGSDERQDVEEMVRAAQRAAEMTRQLLTFSRRQVVEPREVDLNALLAGVDRMLRRMIGEDVALRTEPEAGLRPVWADPGQIEQVILNLAVNARDAMPGGGTLTMRTGHAELDEAAAHERGVRAGRFVCLSVADTGTGMTPEVRARIFEPFFTTKAVGKGTGLGLSTVFGIVRKAGGYVDVHTEPGKGTRFNVFLPQGGGAVPESGEGGAETGQVHGSETILVAEDDAQVRLLTARVLERCGYRVLPAASAEQALAAAANADGIDLLISDVVLPGMSGCALAEGLRRARPGLKVLFISGHDAETVSRQGLASAGVALLQKPFTPLALAEKVRLVIRGTAARPPPGRLGRRSASIPHADGPKSIDVRVARPDDLHLPSSSEPMPTHGLGVPVD